MPKQLSPKRTAFVNAYVSNGFNATQAYLSAGYSPEGATANSARLTANDSIKQAVALRVETKASAAEITLDWLLAQFRGIATNPDEKAADRVAAMRELGKLLGFYIERSVAVAAFVRPELAGRSLAELEAIEAALWPTRAGREPLALGEHARGPLTHAPAGKGGELAVEVEGERDGWA
jgi:hypothetical protein